MKTDKVPTATEFAIKKHGSEVIMDYCGDEHNLPETMIEFAKLHVKAALEAATENAEIEERFSGCRECGAWGVKSDSILNAYPDELIK